ncbi:MAG TPA: YceI family protein, partial [Dehalococcoidia bacterium]|nr:YceI family protein [Dehalococcoidia bacterium]
TAEATATSTDVPEAPTEEQADEPTAADTKTPTEEPSPEPTVPSIDDGEVLTIVPTHPAVQGATEAAYFADEKLARLSLPSTAKGATNDVSGQLVLNANGIHPEYDSIIEVGLTSLRSDRSRRDGKVQEALETSQFPTAVFVATSLTGYPSQFPENQEVPMQLTGMLTIHGVEAEVTWDVIATRTGDVLTALATLETRYEDWDVPVLNIAGSVSVEEDVTLQLQIIAEVT